MRNGQRSVKSQSDLLAQEVLATAEEMKEAAVGGAAADEKGQQKGRPAGFDSAEIAQFLIRNAEQLDRAVLPQGKGISGKRWRERQPRR